MKIYGTPYAERPGHEENNKYCLSQLAEEFQEGDTGYLHQYRQHLRFVDA